MKYLVLFLLGVSTHSFSQSVGINNDGSSPDPSSILDVKSSSAGILVPRLTSMQRTSIASPADGLFVYDTDLKSFFYYNNTNWQVIGGSTELTDSDNDTKILVEATPDEDSIRFIVEGYEFARMDGKTFHLGSPNRSILIGNDAGALDDGGDYFSIAIGDSALYNNSLGSYKPAHSKENIGIGKKALYSNSIGAQNNALGYLSLMNNTSGLDNQAFGSKTLMTNTTGDKNVAIGTNALTSNSNGNSNTAIGSNTLRDNINGSRNIALGQSALLSNISGSSNIGQGYNALSKNENGSYNSAFGYFALNNNISGANNVAIGYYSLIENIDGDGNVAIGRNTLSNAINMSGLVAVGDSALYNNVGGDQNTAIGTKSLKNNIVGAHNTAFGFESLEENVNAKYNTGIGNKSLQKNVSGEFNTSVGYGTIKNNISGFRNSGLGTEALASLVIGSDNTALGAGALLNLENSNNNIAIGSFAGFFNTGGDNVIIGKDAGYAKYGGDGNTLIGYNAGRGSSSHSKTGSVMIGNEAGKDENLSNKLYIDNSSTSSPLIYGDFTSNALRVNGSLEIGTAYEFPVVDGSNGQALTTDGAGNVTWESSTSVLDRTGTAIHPKTSLDDDFIFGGNMLPANGVSILDTLMFFDESKGAFRSGISDGSIVGGKYWSPDSMGVASFSFGSSTMAKGENAGAWGSSNKAIGSNTTAFGQINESYGFTSTSWGGLNDAIGSYSTVWGFNNIAPSAFETVLGRYATTYNPSSETTWSNNDRLFVIGNGANPSSRSNALAIMKNGDTYINGEVLMQSQDNLNRMRLYPDGDNGSSSLYLSEDDLGFRGVEIEYDGPKDKLEIFGKYGSTNYGPHVTVQRISGNVTIGNVEATNHKLSVDGKVACEEVLVELSGNWPDYVFEKEYDLMPLKSLQTYISKNKHLPGIAPAAELEKSGIQLGETNRILTEKVEELTLYLIQLNEMNNDLLKRLETLENK